MRWKEIVTPIPYFRIDLIRKVQDNCEGKESISIHYMSKKKTNVDTNNTGRILKTMSIKRSKSRKNMYYVIPFL